MQVWYTVYVGMKETEKKIQPTGIALTLAEELEFVDWVGELCAGIYPTNQHQAQETSQKHAFQYRVNSYVSVQFISIVDGSSYLDVYTEENGVYKKLYMVKIKIKPGTKAETFHLLKEDKDNEIQCFKRKDGSVAKLSLAEFLELYQQRVHTFLTGK